MKERINGFRKILSSLIEESSGGASRFIFFNTASDDDFSALLKPAMDLFANREVIASSFTGKTGPYQPFMDHIRIEARNTECESLMERAGVYPAHRPLIAAYCSGSAPARQEPLIVEERHYESMMMRRNVASLFRRIYGGRSTVFIIHALDQHPVSSWELVRELIENAGNEPWLFIISLFREAVFPDDYHTEQWDAFIRFIDEQQLLADLGNEAAAAPLLIETPSASVLLSRAHLELEFLAVPDALETIMPLVRRWPAVGSELGTEGSCRLLHTAGRICLLSDETDDAIAALHNLVNFAQKEREKIWLCRAYCDLGHAYLKKENITTAEKFYQQSMKLADELEDTLLRFDAFMLLFQIENRGRKQDISTWRQSYSRLIELTRTLGFINHFAYLTTNPYGIYSELHINSEEMHSNGMEHARRIGNLFRLAAAYQTRGLVYSVRGQYDKVLESYRESRNLRNIIGSKIDIAYITNGMGFYHYMTGWYREADSEFHDALFILIELRDFHEICMTFFNIAVNAWLAFEHKRAALYIDRCITLMKAAGLSNLSYHSMHGILSVAGLCAVEDGNFARAYQYLARIDTEGLQPYPAKNEEFFSHNLLQAKLRYHENDTKGATLAFSTAHEYLMKANDNIQYFAPRFHYETCLFGKLSGSNEEYSTALSAGEAVSAERKNRFYQSIFTKIRKTGAVTATGAGIEDIPIDFSLILESARLAYRIVNLHRKVDAVRFINEFQNLCLSAADTTTLIRDALTYIHYSIPSDAVLLAKRSPKGDKVVHIKTSSGTKTSHVNEALSRCTGNADRPCVCIRGRHLESIICAPVNAESASSGLFMMSFTLKGHFPLKKEDAEILGIVSTQLSAALERIESNRKLERANALLKRANLRLEKFSRTDMLTSLGNRTALFDRMVSEIDRIERYAKKETVLSVLFIDLDNFKYFNDTYGHRAGDALLASFGALLKRLSRRSDSTFRFGGDEFCIILPETGKDRAAILGRRILDELAGKGFFHKKVRDIAPEIPENEISRLGCSIGITEYRKSGKKALAAAEAIIRDADEAQYEAKKNGKNAISLFDGRAI